MTVVGKLRVICRWNNRKTIENLLSFDALTYLIRWDYMFGTGKAALALGGLSRELDRDLRRGSNATNNY